MPAVVAPPSAGKYAAEVQSQLDQAAGKIRGHDVTLGVLLIVAALLGYLAAMIMLDKWLDLDARVRQVAWGIGVAALVGLFYTRILRPLRRIINPLYAAKRVEETLKESKNSIINWVELHDAPIPESVRNSVSARAAKQLTNADLNRAVENRSLVITGAFVAFLVVLLAALLLAYKPVVFGSLASRALNPFSRSTIATRTLLTLTEPIGGDLTITAGQPVTVTVSVEGREPDADAPDRIRALLRYNPSDSNLEEVPLEPVGNREWSVRIPQHLVQNGFWYRIVGGDSETAEHRVTVRPRPVFTDFEVHYEYPPYLNLKNETSRDPHIEAYRGTAVTLIATANRELKDGRMIVGDVPTPINGRPDGATLTFKFTLMDSGSYRLAFTATTGETNVDSPPYSLKILTDSAPVVSFKPQQPPEQTLPMNGLLTIDGQAMDDFGVDRITLMMKLEGGPSLQPRKYRDGLTFRRDDNTWPTTVDYKDSVKIESLRSESGEKLNLKPDDVIEYWLEAADNCTVPTANVGRSKIYKVRLTPAAVEKEAIADQNTKAELRQKDEAAHREKQDLANRTESRPKQAGPQEKKATPANATRQDAEKPESGEKSSPPAAAEKATEPSTADKASDPTQKPDPQDAELQKQAEQVQKAIDEMNKQPGEARSGDAARPDQPEPSPSAKKEGEGKSTSSELKPQSSDRNQAAGEKSESSTPSPAKSSESKSESAGNEASESRSSTGANDTGTEKSPEMKPQENPGNARPQGDGAQPEKKKQMQTTPGEEKPGSPDAEKTQSAGSARNQTPPKAGERKPGDEQKKPMTGDGSYSESKPAPDANRGGESSQAKPSAANQQAGAERGMPGENSKSPDWNQVEQAGRELSHENPGKREAAKQQLEDMLGRDQAKEAENLFRDRQSSDPKIRENAEREIDELRKKVEQKQKQAGAGDAQNSSDLADATKDLKSDDATRKEAAQKKLDAAMREQAAREAQKLADDLQSSDAATKAAAEKKLDDLMKQAREQAQNDPQAGQNSKGMEDALKDLKSSDKDKMRDAAKALDKAMTERAAKEAEQLAKDLQSSDPATKAAAEKKFEEVKQQAEKMTKDQNKSTDTQDRSEAMKDFNSSDPSKRQAAQEKLNQAMKEESRRQAEQLAKDLQSSDPATKAAAEKKLEDLQKANEELTKDLAQAAKDLQSGDAAKQEAARKKLDELIGERARKDGEQLMKDLQSEDSKTREAAQKKLQEIKQKLDEWAKNAPPARDPKSGSPAAAGNDTRGEPLKATEDFAKRSGQLQLEPFKKQRDNRELLKRLGWTQADYDRFIKGYEQMLNRQDASRPPQTVPQSPSVEKLNTGSAGKVEQRGTLTAGSPQSAGAANAPPGYSEAQKRFLEEARKAQEKK